MHRGWCVLRDKWVRIVSLILLIVINTSWKWYSWSRSLLLLCGSNVVVRWMDDRMIGSREGMEKGSMIVLRRWKGGMEGSGWSRYENSSSISGMNMIELKRSSNGFSLKNWSEVGDGTSHAWFPQYFSPHLYFIYYYYYNYNY